MNLISMMILALCKVKTVNYRALANVFDSCANAESSMRRIQRFMADFDLPMKLVLALYFRFCQRKIILYWSWTGRIGSLGIQTSIF
ncbi:hypothetical protein [Chryseobacterium sp. Hurlbut01]|uniref:hypothetical protein n=1 Tax=Chryseobacterium sp. Hurlbut01 TaxID=1681828 RepID=UPI001F255F3F|nr:hypothetical protein [Chryseobacterium sp. Hurlbut01]